MDLFPFRLMSTRKAKGMRQADLADKVGVTHQSISLYEKGSRLPDCRVLIDLAKVLDTSIDYLVGISSTPGNTFYRNKTENPANTEVDQDTSAKDNPRSDIDMTLYKFRADQEEEKTLIQALLQNINSFRPEYSYILLEHLLNMVVSIMDEWKEWERKYLATNCEIDEREFIKSIFAKLSASVGDFSFDLLALLTNTKEEQNAQKES